LIGSINAERQHANLCLCSTIIERQQRDPLPKAAMYSKSSTPTPREWVARRTSGRYELLAWAKARDFRERANEYLNRGLELDGDVRRRMELLLKRNMLTREVAWGVLYGHRPDADQPQYRVVSTIIHHLRNRLLPHGVEITTEQGTGWYLKKKDREKLEHLLACKP
jgi:hypothetical protein